MLVQSLPSTCLYRSLPELVRQVEREEAAEKSGTKAANALLKFDRSGTTWQVGNRLQGQALQDRSGNGLHVLYWLTGLAILDRSGTVWHVSPVWEVRHWIIGLALLLDWLWLIWQALFYSWDPFLRGQALFLVEALFQEGRHFSLIRIVCCMQAAII